MGSINKYILLITLVHSILYIQTLRSSSHLEINFSTIDSSCNCGDTLAPEFSINHIVFEIGINGSIPIFTSNDFIDSLSDNCTDFLEIEITPAFISLECRDIGTNHFLITAIDTTGYTYSDSLTIELIDNEIPLILCPAPVSETGCDSIFYSQPFIADNCDIDTFVL